MSSVHGRWAGRQATGGQLRGEVDGTCRGRNVPVSPRLENPAPMSTEQRSASRQQIPGTHVAIVDVESGVEFDATAHDVSPEGLRFLSALEPPVGADMQVTLSGGAALRASLHVVRVTKVEQGYQVAGRLSRVA
jgi:hypothetical protein